jgi:hypothetical protein
MSKDIYIQEAMKNFVDRSNGIDPASYITVEGDGIKLVVPPGLEAKARDILKPMPTAEKQWMDLFIKTFKEAFTGVPMTPAVIASIASVASSMLDDWSSPWSSCDEEQANGSHEIAVPFELKNDGVRRIKL